MTDTTKQLAEALRKGIAALNEESVLSYTQGAAHTEMQEALAAYAAAQPAPSEQPAQGEAVESAAKAVFQQLPGWCSQPWVDGGNSLKQDEARRYARAALAQRPALVAMTDKTLHDLWLCHSLMDRPERGMERSRALAFEFANAAIAEFCRVNGIAAPAAQGKQG